MMFNFLDKIGSAKANLDLGLAVLKTMLESLKPYADKPFVELIIGKSCKDISNLFQILTSILNIISATSFQGILKY